MWLLQVTFLSTMVLTCVAAFILALLYTALSTTAPIDVTILIENYRGSIRQKPEERFVFLALVFLVSITVYLYILATFSRNHLKSDRHHQTEILWPVIITITLLAPISGFSFGESIFTGIKSESEYPWTIFFLSIAFACSIGYVRHRFLSRTSNSPRIAAFADILLWTAFIVFMILQISA